MGKKNFQAGQLIPTSSTPPGNAGFYRIDKNTIGVVGNLVQKNANTNAESNVSTGANLASELAALGVYHKTNTGISIVAPPVVGITTQVSATCSIIESVSVALEGELVWKITATSVGSSQYFEIIIPNTKTFSATDSTTEMYIDDPLKITGIASYIGTSGYSKYISFNHSAFNVPTTTRAPRTKGWNAFQVSKSQWTKSGSISSAEISDQLWTDSKIRVTLGSDVTTTVYLRSVHVGSRSQSRIAIVFDDGYLSVPLIGTPILQEYNLLSTTALVVSRVDDIAGGFAALTDWRRYVASGNACCPHGPTANSGNGNLFSVHSTNSARLDDVNQARTYIVNNNLAANNSENCYVWPQGVFCDSTTDLSFLSDMLNAGFVLGRGITATFSQYSHAATISARNTNRLVLNEVGHSWSVADEAANIATVIARIQAAAADGYDCILTLHKVVGYDAAASTIEISSNRLREICAAISVLISNGSMQSVLLPDLNS